MRAADIGEFIGEGAGYVLIAVMAIIVGMALVGTWLAGMIFICGYAVIRAPFIFWHRMTDRADA